MFAIWAELRDHVIEYWIDDWVPGNDEWVKTKYSRDASDISVRVTSAIMSYTAIGLDLSEWKLVAYLGQAVPEVG